MKAVIVLAAHRRHHVPRRLPAAIEQRGVALVVALILLVVITLVGLAAVSGTIMQQKMSSNFYDRDVAFQAAEAALRQAQVAIGAATSGAAAPAGFYDCSPPAPNGTGANNPCQTNPFNDSNVPAADTVPVPPGSYSAGPMAASQPQYIVQYMGKFALPTPPVRQLSGCSGYLPCSPPGLVDFYRITARSGPANANGRASVTLQSVFRN
jgi:Tfp pilus assembly protein PilX